MINLQNDPNLVRRDMWFSYPEDVVPFLTTLFQEHPGLPPELVSAALMQARKNMATTLQRDGLKQEVSRLLNLPLSWELTALCSRNSRSDEGSPVLARNPRRAERTVSNEIA
jgi:hypothetical protein